MNTENKMKEVVFFIRANTFERLTLHQQHHKNDLIWEEDRIGLWQTVGYIDDDKNKPVNVAFSFAVIFGSRICFYETCSRFNDSKMVEDWVETNYPARWDNGNRRAMTDAQNFHHAITHCRVLASNRPTKKM